MGSVTVPPHPTLRGGTYRRFHVDSTFTGSYYVSYIHESAPACAGRGIGYVEDVRSLAIHRGLPVIIVTYTAPSIIRAGWKPRPDWRPRDAEYMHRDQIRTLRPHLFYMPVLAPEIIVPYTMEEVNERLDALPGFREVVPDDLRETIGEFLHVH